MVALAISSYATFGYGYCIGLVQTIEHFHHQRKSVRQVPVKANQEDDCLITQLTASPAMVVVFTILQLSIIFI